MAKKVAEKYAELKKPPQQEVRAEGDLRAN
jgi:hypothetical protein